MPRHSKSRIFDPVIDFLYAIPVKLISAWLWVDMRYCRVVRYLRNAPTGEIIKDFLATVAVLVLILYSPVCLLIGIHYFPW